MSKVRMHNAQTENLPPREEQKTFHFITATHLLRIGRELAASLSELIQALQTQVRRPLASVSGTKSA